MKVTVFPCGPAANESELKAIEYLKSRLLSKSGNDEWILLTNLTFAVNHQLQADEIDIVVIGPPGVKVVEVKHWSGNWMDKNEAILGHEADLVTNKARKIGTTLRKRFDKLPFVEGVILLTQDTKAVDHWAGKIIRGANFYTLKQWEKVVGFNEKKVLISGQAKLLSHVLAPNSSVAIDGSLRRLAGYVNLELQSPKDFRFHRIYKGIHSISQDKVILHLYDLTVKEKNPKDKARREFETLRRLQLFPWAPRILDSFQEAPGYLGEMCFFTIVDPLAPNIKKRSKDKNWETEQRIAFSKKALQALGQLQYEESEKPGIVHRNLIPKNILVKHDNSPIFIGFEYAKIPSDVSVATAIEKSKKDSQFIAPEILKGGLGAADFRSDIYSLCKSLYLLFKDSTSSLSQLAVEILSKGVMEEPDKRSSLENLLKNFSVLEKKSVPSSSTTIYIPPARFWSEGQVVTFHDRDYKIVSQLGSGGIGTTFKVVEIEKQSEEEIGTYVAKVVHEEKMGNKVLESYSLARSHLGMHPGLSTIFEIAREWNENNFIALMTWIEGTPLDEFKGVFPLLAEDLQESSSQELAKRWLRRMCEALGILHKSGLIHGDVSPKNMIVSGNELVLTDYDFVRKIGDLVTQPATILYCSPAYEENRPASPSDDIYALAASFFHVMFEKEPFRYNGNLDKKKGLNWEKIRRSEYENLVEFFDKATHPDPGKRFSNVEEAMKILIPTIEKDLSGIEDVADGLGEKTQQPGEIVVLTEQKVKWLQSLLRSYPGSPLGNDETRGLDTPFATQTYVESLLEETLFQEVTERSVRLIILCGNAGDGKTALLQHLARKLGMGEYPSSERIIEKKISNHGPLVRINLDGSAGWRGRSADEILDEFLEPFQEGPPTQDIVHLLAINDGRLLEWIEGVESRRNGATPLTNEIYELLQEGAVKEESFIHFVNLNHRSLVGGISSDRGKIETKFLDRLLDSLYGGERASEIWRPCKYCSAKNRCEVFRTVRIFGPKSVTFGVSDETRARARQRLFEAFQAVHMRGETHITVRELRATLVYILFGIHYCEDYHNQADYPFTPYWDRAFSPNSPFRQGEVLSELVHFDPALESHPQIDRYLVGKSATESSINVPRYSYLTIESARRRSYFEWTEENIREIAGDSYALGLAKGSYLKQFKEIAFDGNQGLREEVLKRFCDGISRIEDLPPQAFERPGVVPLRITPRTPTETAFWVEKPLESFSLVPDLPAVSKGIDQLHHQVFLLYRYRNGQEERLRLGAELFNLLLELSEGYQLGDASTEDVFANLSIFVQRLVREDERELFAWSPMEDDKIFRVSAELRETEEGPKQFITLKPLV